VEHTGLAFALADRWLTARAGLALLLANIRYWPTVAPVVRTELHRWEQHALRIPDPVLKALALQKLHDERFNAQVAATLAVTSPRANRKRVVEAIVAYEVMYDYLDGLTEQPTPDPLRDGHQLFRAFTDAVNPNIQLDTNYYHYHPRAKDGGYLKELASAVKLALAQLPALGAISEAAQVNAVRCAEAQIRVHATPEVGASQLRDWATREATTGSGLEWREFLAGAVASVLAVHALIAAAADQRTTREQAAAIGTTYLSISALSTMLDSLIDYERDVITGRPWLLEQYEDHTLKPGQLTNVARHATRRARTLPNAAHHTMTLVGVVAYYTSAPAASGELARPPIAHLHHALRPLITPTLAVMRAWRLAKQLRRSARHRAPPTNEQPT